MTCDARDRRSEYIKHHPKLIIEVLSRTTAVLDRGGNLDDYCSLASLEEYLLVSQDEMRVECIRRVPEGGWHECVYVAGDDVHLKSIGLSFPIEQIYDRAQFGAYGEADEGEPE